MLSFFQKKDLPAHLVLGRLGEKIAMRVLEQHGLELLGSNYNVQGKGEIDIIARDGFCLCFVEVKTRHHNKISRPADAVSLAKRKRLLKASQAYIKETQLPRSIPMRFDVVEVVFDKKDRLETVTYLSNFFNKKGL